MKTTGYLIILMAVLVSLNLFILSKPDPGIILNYPLLSLGQLTALIGTTLIGISFHLSSRFFWLERLFGGLDKLYKAHHLISGIAFILLLNHPLLLAASRLPDARMAFFLLTPGNDTANTLGIIALWGFLILICLTLYVRIPYHLWKKTHEWMGLPLALALLHIILIKSDVSGYPPLRIYMLAITLSGLGSYVYKRFLYHLLGPSYPYLISSINQTGSIFEIYLTPADSRVMRFIPGQFVYLTPVNGANRKNSESHPFTISSSPDSGHIRLTVKISGDGTGKLATLKPGSEALISGPYGAFSDRFFQTRTAVCIAGGIGITPFIPMIKRATVENPDRNIYLFHAVSHSEDMLYDPDFTDLTQKYPHFKYIPHNSKLSGRLNTGILRSRIMDLTKPVYFLCGPSGFMQGMKKSLTENGVKPADIITEEFSLI
jgi:predicted ferric reductase